MHSRSFILNENTPLKDMLWEFAWGEEFINPGDFDLSETATVADLFPSDSGDESLAMFEQRGDGLHLVQLGGWLTDFMPVADTDVTFVAQTANVKWDDGKVVLRELLITELTK